MKTVLVTGVSSGIGFAICQFLLEKDWTVIGFSRRKPDFEHPNFRHHSIDISDDQQLLKALDQMPSVDGVVHAAGMMASAPLGDLNSLLSEQLWHLHVKAPELILNRLIHRMPDGSRIILIGSRTSGGAANRSQYAATKSAMIGMVRSWAKELAPRQITVNIVAPAATETPMLHDPKRKTSSPVLPPIGRYIRPEEVAAMTEFLLSEYGGAITGQQVLICGGASL